MAYLSLYRKYRPDTWDKVIGQKYVVRTLINQIERKTVTHAYLFTGTRGTGKTTSAKIFARAINCLHPVDGSPCGECEICRALRGEGSIDIIEMDAASNNGVEEIRDLRENVQYPPSVAKYKVYIIDEVHMLSASAFNALLKTLEEPPEHAVFILATTEVHKLPATILSRCMRFDFRLVPKAELTEHLEKILEAEGVPYEKGAPELIAEQGEGSVRDMLSLADMCLAYSPDRLTVSAVYDVLGTSEFGSLKTLAEALLAGDVSSVLCETERVYNRGKGFTVLNKELARFFRELVTVKNVPGYKGDFSEEEFSAIAALAKQYDNYRIARIMQILASAEGDLRYSTRPRITFEAILVKAAAMYTDASVEALVSRITALEKAIASGAVPSFKSVPEASSKPQVSADDIQKRITDFSGTGAETEVADVQIFEEKTATARDGKAEVFMGGMLTELRTQKRRILYNALNAQQNYSLRDGVFVVNASDASSYDMLTEENNLKALEDAAKRLSAGTVSLKVVSDAVSEEKRVKHTAVDRAKLYDLLGGRLKEKK